MKKNGKRVLAVCMMILAGFAMVGCGATASNAGKGDITVVSREDGSGTRGAFIELTGVEEKDAAGNKTDKTTADAVIANKTDVAMTNVENDGNAIGYISLGSLNDKVKAIKVNGVEATAENVKKGDYKLARPFNIATKGDPNEVSQDFINFILSKDGQKVVSETCITIDDKAPEFKTTKPSGKITVAGSSSVTPTMEKLKEAYLKVNPNAEIEIQMSDSTAGMMAAMDGTCDIGMASRDLKDEEKSQLKATPIALDGIAIIVNKDNPIKDISIDMLKQIYTGAVKTWEDVK